MKLTTPLYALKHRAKALSRQRGLPLHAALDHVAQDEGFARWSLLAAQRARQGPANALLAQLQPGELLLLAARPGQGKTLLGLELALKTAKAGGHGWFFSLEWTRHDLLEHLAALGEDPAAVPEGLLFDSADTLCADHVVQRLNASPHAARAGTVVVIDYLQILDQRRQNPELQAQVRTLKQFALERGLVVVFISQVDRAFDANPHPLPRLDDVRLPNPLDLSLFNKACFVHQGAIQVSALA